MCDFDLSLCCAALGSKVKAVKLLMLVRGVSRVDALRWLEEHGHRGVEHLKKRYEGPSDSDHAWENPFEG